MTDKLLVMFCRTVTHWGSASKGSSNTACVHIAASTKQRVLSALGDGHLGQGVADGTKEKTAVAWSKTWKKS
jgi:hypothetical protein